MSATSLVAIGAITPTAGILGAISWPHAQRKLNLSNLHALVALVSLAVVLPVYGCLGILPIFSGVKDDGKASLNSTALRFGGLTTPGEMYVLALYFGEFL
jgi:UMF1 family MFS transporter